MSASDISGYLSGPAEQLPQGPQSVCAGATLDFWSCQPWSNGVQIDQMDEMQRLLVRTRNSCYEITVMDRWTGDIAVRGGQFFPRATFARLAGATLGGSILKLRGIYIGWQMEIHVEEGPLLTTRVKMIAVEKPGAGQKLLF
jgi:hypothetical protein